jgi:hypothetical protein
VLPLGFGVRNASPNKKTDPNSYDASSLKLAAACCYRVAGYGGDEAKPDSPIRLAFVFGNHGYASLVDMPFHLVIRPSRSLD